MKTLESYLLAALDQGITEHHMTMANPNERMIDLMGESVLAPTRVYIRPEGSSGETVAFAIEGNELSAYPVVPTRKG